MAGNKTYSWIRILKSDKVKMESYFRSRGITNHSIMFKRLVRGKK